MGGVLLYFSRFFTRFIEEICYGMNGIEDVDDLGVYQSVCLVMTVMI